MPTPVRTKILAPLDGSKLGEHALKQFVALVPPASIGEIVLLQVVEPATPGGPLRLDAGPALRALAGREDKARRYLEGVRRNLGRRNVRTRAVTRAGTPADEILGCAKAERADVIVMSTQGKTGLRRVLIGSVAESVLRRAPVPVFVGKTSRARG